MKQVHMHDPQLNAWQVEVQPLEGGPPYTTVLYATSAHEARMLGSRTTQRPNLSPGRVLDVCLYEIAKARAAELAKSRVA